MTTMRRISYEEVDITPYSTSKDSVFISEDIGYGQTYQSLCDKFKEYRFEEHIQNIREEFECQSYSTLIFYIVFEFKEENNEYIMFCSELEIPSRDEIEYTVKAIAYETRDKDKKVDKYFQENNYNKIYVKAKMSTKFYINRRFDIINQYEAEQLEDLHDEGDDDEDLQPAIIETCFISDKCSACLSEKPNILNIPCLHLSICNKCEEVGKLIRCLVCREKIERKIKI